MSTDDDRESHDRWLTYQEAANHFGISVNAVTLRVKRGKLLATRGNDGHPKVCVRLSDDMSTQSPQLSKGLSRPVRTDVRQTEPVVSVEPMMSVSQAMALVSEERADATRRITEIQTMHLDLMNRLQTQGALERSIWMERVDAAELRAERVEQRLDEVIDHLLKQQSNNKHEPWWKRWLGSSATSSLRRD